MPNIPKNYSEALAETGRFYGDGALSYEDIEREFLTMTSKQRIATVRGLEEWATVCPPGGTPDRAAAKAFNHSRKLLALHKKLEAVGR
jgi:hypothetical protein